MVELQFSSTASSQCSYSRANSAFASSNSFVVRFTWSPSGYGLGSVNEKKSSAVYGKGNVVD